MKPPTAVRVNLVRDVANCVIADNEIDYPPVPARNILSRYAKIITYDKPILQGFCIREGTNYIVGFNQRYSLYRHEWTYAHELGHVLLRHMTYDQSTLTQENITAMRREAELFAANLLMPENWMSQLYNEYGLGSFYDLRRYVQLFNVSWQAMQIRLEELGLCDKDYLYWITKKSV